MKSRLSFSQSLRHWFSHSRSRSPRCAKATGRPADHSQLALESLERRTLMAGDIILDWNAVLLRANANDYGPAGPEQGGPVLDARAFAIVSAAMYDAYNSIEHIGSTYLTTAPNSQNASSDAAVAQAAHDTLVSLYSRQTDFFDKKLQESLDQIPDGEQENRGRAVGEYVADKILEARADDHADLIDDPPHVPEGEPGFHIADPVNPNQGYYGSHGGDISPFAITSPDDFQSRALDDGTPEGRLAFLKSQEYVDAYNEVKSLGGDGIHTPTSRTEEQTNIGLFWAYDGRPGLGTPMRLYNQIVRKIANDEGNTEAENARLFALVNIALGDAGVTCWNTKYDLDFWRPVVGIREGGSDGNQQTAGDANWYPLGAPASNPLPGDKNFTPPFPAYTSGHATFGGAVFQTLARFYDRDDISFSFVSDELNGKTKDVNGNVRPLVERTFNSFTEAKLENAQSRIYLGVHWRFDADEGVKQGTSIGNYVYDHMLKPNGESEAPVVSGLGGPVWYAENAAPKVLSFTATVADPDSPNFDGGTLTLKMLSGGEAADRIGMRSAGILTIDGNEVKYQDLVIGTYSGGKGEQPMVVALNANATPYRVQTLLRNVTYHSASENPSAAARRLSVVLTDGDGGASQVATKDIRVVPKNDAPVIALGGGSVGYQLKSPAILLSSTATLKDADSANFANGWLKVQVTEGAVGGDRLSIGGAFKVSNGEVLWNNSITIGTVQSGGGIGGTPLVVRLNENATLWRVGQLLRSIKFSTFGANSLGERAVAFTAHDGKNPSEIETLTVNVAAN